MDINHTPAGEIYGQPTLPLVLFWALTSQDCSSPLVNKGCPDGAIPFCVSDVIMETTTCYCLVSVCKAYLSFLCLEYAL